MPVKFDRKVRKSQAEDMRKVRKKIADDLRRQPSVGVTLEAGEARSAGKNTTIYRTHRKRIGKAMEISKKTAAAILAAVDKRRQRYKKTGSRGDKRKFALAIAKRMEAEVKSMIKSNGLWKTGELYRSVSHETKNV